MKINFFYNSCSSRERSDQILINFFKFLTFFIVSLIIKYRGKNKITMPKLKDSAFPATALQAELERLAPSISSPEDLFKCDSTALSKTLLRTLHTAHTPLEIIKYKANVAATLCQIFDSSSKRPLHWNDFPSLEESVIIRLRLRLCLLLDHRHYHRLRLHYPPLIFPSTPSRTLEKELRKYHFYSNRWIPFFKEGSPLEESTKL